MARSTVLGETLRTRNFYLLLAVCLYFRDTVFREHGVAGLYLIQNQDTAEYEQAPGPEPPAGGFSEIDYAEKRDEYHFTGKE